MLYNISSIYMYIWLFIEKDEHDKEELTALYAE